MTIDAMTARMTFSTSDPPESPYGADEQREHDDHPYQHGCVCVHDRTSSDQVETNT
jgi:hypothetical protein